ncbi:MAG: methylenetetrahydrofolate reductase [NAD(P)H] [Alphaproteobacteria bacterium]|nr:methylenetetrahydrofolate reductase [NAD(P)H] [Alphaproteobacteria bacterium]
MEQQLWASIQRLAPLRPAYVSVTYGAGGGTRARTHATVQRIRDETELEPAAHLTCVGATRDEVDAVARSYWQAGITQIVALRGDPPAGSDHYTPHPGGYAFAADLIAGLKRVADFRIFAAAYPEVHPEAASAEADLDNLKRKLDAGASTAITQYFFDNACFYRFLDRVRQAGITAPVIPGILPVTNFATVKRFSEACGATVPDWLAARFEGLDDDPETRKLVAASVAIEQCQDLCDNDVEEFHFYTLNRAELTYAICHSLGIRPDPVAVAADKAVSQ